MLAAALLLAALGLELAGEFVQAHRPEDPLLEELLDQGEERVFAEVDPFLVCVNLDGGAVAVARSVGAGVVVVALLTPRMWSSPFWLHVFRRCQDRRRDDRCRRGR